MQLKQISLCLFPVIKKKQPNLNVEFYFIFVWCSFKHQDNLKLGPLNHHPSGLFGFLWESDKDIFI